MQRTIKRILYSLVYFYQRFVGDACAYRAASLAYTTLLSLVPLLVVSFSILSLVPAFHGVGARIQHFIVENFVATSAAVISQYLMNFVQHVSRLSIFNLVFLAIVALLLMYNINLAFNSIWRAQRHFHLTLSFLGYFLVLLLSPIVLGGVMILGGFLIRVPMIADIVRMAYVQKPLFFVLPVVLIFVIFTVFNWVLPSCKVRLFHAAIGGLVSAILFEIAKYGFTVYLTKFPTYRLIYGTLATIPIFLVWLYVSWTIILLGVLTANICSEGIPKNEKIIRN